MTTIEFYSWAGLKASPATFSFSSPPDKLFTEVLSVIQTNKIIW